MNELSKKTQVAEPLAASQQTASASLSRRGFFLLRLGFLALVLVALGMWVQDWFQTSTLYVHETDARITTDLVTVASETAGRISQRHVGEGSAVEVGAVLVSLDAAAAELRLAELVAGRATITAELARVEAEVDMVRASTSSRLAAERSRLEEVRAREEILRHEHKFTESDLGRAQSLAKSGAVSAARLDRSRTDFLKAQRELQQVAAEIITARARIAESEASVSEVRIKQAEQDQLQAERAELDARIESQRIEIEHHAITSPLSGVVGRTFVKSGEFIQPGQRLMVVHDPNSIWVETNIRETDYGRLRVGQTVRVEVDAYPDEVFDGKIERLGNAATSQFALLPRLNESGSFTKVTQRLPVRVAVAQRDGKLKPGMMVEVFIDAIQREWKWLPW